MYQNIIDELINIENKFVAFLKNCFDYYPYCCYQSSDIINKYIVNKFPGTNIKMYKVSRKNSRRYNVNFHVFIVINNNIVVDFTYLQYRVNSFVARSFHKKYSDNDIVSVYHKIQESCIFNIEKYKKEFENFKEIPSSDWIDGAEYDDDFDKYILNVENYYLGIIDEENKVLKILSNY